MSETPQGSTLIPSVLYRDAPAAIEWLERALGFTRHVVYTGEGGVVNHAELRHGSTGMVMLGSLQESNPNHRNTILPADTGGRVTASMYLVVESCDPVWRSAQGAGADVVMELRTMDYGGRAFTVRDPEGYLWAVGEYSPWTAREAAS